MVEENLGTLSEECKMVEESVWTLSEDPDIRVFLTTNSLDLNESSKFVSTPGSGAVASFIGTTRDNFEGKNVSKLSYEAHKPLALRSLYRICEKVKRETVEPSGEKCIHRILVGHKLGDVPVMDKSVIICVSSTHRVEAWEAASRILEEVKEKVEIWKNESYDDGSSGWKQNDNANVINR